MIEENKRKNSAIVALMLIFILWEVNYLLINFPSFVIIKKPPVCGRWF